MGTESNEMHFDLLEDATRASIVRQLEAALPGDADDIDACVAKAGVPDAHHHNLAEINRTIEALQGVSDRVRNDMREIYQVLTEAEASVHGVDVDEAHFHEVGRAAGVRNVLKICLLVEAVDPTRITATRVQPGSGKIECAHGLLDVPAPATASILSWGIPLAENVREGELVTPTSAAVIYHFVDEYVW